MRDGETFARLVVALLDQGATTGRWELGEGDRDRVNVNGSGISLGHPVGATGARILATLLSALETTGGRRGLASLCIGGGEATAMAVELMR